MFLNSSQRISPLSETEVTVCPPSGRKAVSDFTPKTRTLEQAGRLIIEQADTIVESWIDHVSGDSHDSAAHRTHLRDHLPEWLANLGNELVKQSSVQSPATEQAAEAHGRQRWHLGWRIEEVVYDYQSLRPVIFGFLRQQLSDPLPTDVTLAIENKIDEAIADSLRSYRSFQEDQDNESYQRASEFAALVASSSDAIIGMNATGEIKSWNQAAERFYGYTAEEVEGKQAEIVFPEERKIEFEQVLSTVQRNESIRSMETVRLTKSGEKKPVTISVSPICNRSGEVIGCASIERDVSDREKSAEALRRALDAAEAANQAKSEFLANVSHELRTPMNAIIGMTALSLQDNLAAEVRDNLQTAHDAAQVMLSLVNDLLDISRLETGLLDAEDKQFSLRRMIDETIRVVSVKAYQKGLNMRYRVDRNVPDRLIGDAIRLQQIITNLIDNGVKFTDTGEVTVDVSLMSYKQDRCEVEFIIRDTGVGISALDQQHIFEPFFQVEASSTRRFGGTGLGLAIADRLAKHLEASLQVQSEPGKGSEFRLRVPLNPAAPKLEAEKFAATAQQLKGLRLLVVDSDRRNAAIIEQLAKSWEMEPITVPDAATAMRYLEESRDQDPPIGVVLVEALLKGTDGFDLAQRIASSSPSAPTTLLMISPSDRLKLRQRCQDSRVDGFLDKPLCESALFDSIVEGLSTKSPRIKVQPRQVSTVKPDKPLHVLIVEDTEANRKVATQALTRRGHEVTIAMNGQEAIEHFRQDKFDIVLMDIQMPIMDGLEATNVLRQLEQKQGDEPPVPIIAMTAHAMLGDREKYLASGMDEYLAKPIDVAELVETVETVAEQSGDLPHTSATTESATNKKSPMLAEQESINIDTALERLLNDRDLLKELADCYLEDYKPLLADLEKAMTGDDYKTAARSAHTLKGLAANFDAMRTPAIAAAMQQAASEGNKTELEELLPELKKSAAGLAAILTHLE